MFNYMKTRLLLLAAAAAVTPALCLAQTDTVRVIDKPDRVVITECDSVARVLVDGHRCDHGYQFDYSVRSGNDGKLVTEKKEVGQLEWRYPFCRRDSVNRKRHFQVFLSDVYVGWGGTTIGPGYGDAIKRGMSEFGVLNFVGLGYCFNQSRSRLSIGLGFNFSRYSLNHPNFWTRKDGGIVGVEPSTEQIDKHRATLFLYSMQFPLLFNQSLGKRWNVAAGMVMNWNYYADFTNGYRFGKTDYNATTHGLTQRKLSFDVIAMLSWHGIGAYFRYAPQSVLKPGMGPAIDNRWTLGIVLRGL